MRNSKGQFVKGTPSPRAMEGKKYTEETKLICGRCNAKKHIKYIQYATI